MTRVLGFVHVGPTWHGVTRFGRSVADAVDAGDDGSTVRIDVADAATIPLFDAPHRCSTPVDMWIVQFSDHLYARTPIDAALRLTTLVDALAPAPVAVVLHDVPDATDPAEPRAVAYRRVAERAEVVVVCSHHEAERLRRCAYTGAARVIPHIVAGHGPSASRPTRSDHPMVGLLGFVYPGKGHLAGVRACARQPGRVGFVALGRPSPGHEAMVQVFGDEADHSGVPCIVTGWVTDAELDLWVEHVDVPIAPYECVSASGSLATWLAAGRRPIVRDGPYIAELAALAPGTLTVYDGADPDALVHEIGAALATPARTRHGGLPAVLGPEACAAAYVGLAR